MSRKGKYLSSSVFVVVLFAMCVLTIFRSTEVQASWRDDTWGREFVEEEVGEVLKAIYVDLHA